MIRFILAVILGIVIGAAAATYWFAYSHNSRRGVFTVSAVTSHYRHEGDNSETTLRIYVSGSSGHVEEVLCLFPPDFRLTKRPDGTWAGIKKVRIGKVGREYMFGEVGYYCYRVE